MTIDLEFRSLIEPVEFRAQGTKLTASGIAIRYGVPSRPFPRAGKTIREEFRSSAFVKTIQERPVLALYEHNREKLLGNTASGTMRLVNSGSELGYEIDLPDNTTGRDVATLLERKDLNGSSVAFRSARKDEQWSVDDEGFARRSVGTAMLDHIAPTCAPVHDDTAIGLALRSLSEQTGIEVRSLMERIDDLSSLILHPEEDRSEDDDDEHGRVTTVHRPRISYLY